MGPRAGLDDVVKSNFLTLPGLELIPIGRLAHCFSIAGPRPSTGPSSYRKKNLPGRGLTKIENHCSNP
jgi:hypothetical protein